MVRDPLAGFDEITPPGSTPTPPADPDYYPGSKKKRRAVAGPRDPWDDVPSIVLTVKGVPTVFYTIAVLAEFLERKPPAIRKWERLGYIPETKWRTPGRTHHGQKRLYTRAQIEGMVKIAQEEGLLGESNRNVSATAFTDRTRKLFKELKS